MCSALENVWCAISFVDSLACMYRNVSLTKTQSFEASVDLLWLNVAPRKYKNNKNSTFKQLHKEDNRKNNPQN